MKIRILVLSLCMLCTGTLNTISTKYQDLAIVGTLSDGSPAYFRHPAVQSACMFFGEMLCLIPYFLNKVDWQGDAPRKPGPNSGKPRSFHVRRALAFAVPALCDAIATTLLNVGLFYTYASTFQMLRGTLVLFAGCFTILILRRHLYIHHWLGMVCITAGAALVGAASIINSQHQHSGGGGDEGGGDLSLGGTLLAILQKPQMLLAVVRDANGDAAATAPLFGDIMVVMAQMFTALQFILEEKFLSSYQVPPLLAVGMEGAWGMALCLVGLPILAIYRTSDGLPVDDAVRSIREMADNPQLLAAVLVSILSIGLFNFFGISLTKALSGAARATIDACRTLFVWLVCLALGWEKFLNLQVVGFIVLLAGTSLYNELLKTCLPKTDSFSADESVSSADSSSDAADDEETANAAVIIAPAAGQELQQPLLATQAKPPRQAHQHQHQQQAPAQQQQQPSKSTSAGPRQARTSSSASAARGPPVGDAGGGAGGGGVGRSGGSRVSALPSHVHHSAPKPMGGKRGVTEDYSMARSLRSGRQMLNPRALDEIDSYPGLPSTLDVGSANTDGTDVLDGSVSPDFGNYMAAGLDGGGGGPPNFGGGLSESSSAADMPAEITAAPQRGRNVRKAKT